MNKKDTLIVLGFIVVFVLGMVTLQFVKTVEVMTKDTLQEIQYNASATGYQSALYDLHQGSLNCKPIKLPEFNNQSINLIAVECLNLNNEGGNK